jgi:hypothetical protein
MLNKIILKNMVSLIVPCAGKSSRFIGKPKWMLTCPNGNLMIQEAINCLDLENINKIYITFVKEHIDKYFKDYDIISLFKFIKDKEVIITILDDFTSSQTETVYLTIVKNKIEEGIFIKDCDNYFNHKIEKGNYICSLEINEKNNVTKLYNKSFIEINNLDQIINICEKKIINNIICVGGYSFESSDIFKKFYEKSKVIKLEQKEFYISHLVHYCLLNKLVFYSKLVENYIDWGTPEEWFNYRNSFKTLFIDIDGTIFYNTGKYNSSGWGDKEPIKENLDYLKKLYSNGRTKIILTTARSSESRVKTILQLNKYNVPYDDIIFDLFHTKRFLINDFANSNPYPSAVAINLKRDDNNLEKLFN